MSQLQFFFLNLQVMRTKIYSLSNFQIYSIVNASHHAVYYIPRAYSSYNWKFVPKASFFIS